MLAFLMNNKLACALTLLIAGLIIAIGVLKIENDHDALEIEKQKTEIASLLSVNADFKAAVDRQDAAVARLQQDAAARDRRAAAALAAASASAKTHQQIAAAIKTQKVSGDECAQANALLSDYLTSNITH